MRIRTRSYRRLVAAIFLYAGAATCLVHSTTAQPTYEGIPKRGDNAGAVAVWDSYFEERIAAAGEPLADFVKKHPEYESMLREFAGPEYRGVWVADQWQAGHSTQIGQIIVKLPEDPAARMKAFFKLAPMRLTFSQDFPMDRGQRYARVLFSKEVSIEETPGAPLKAYRRATRLLPKAYERGVPGETETAGNSHQLVD